MVAFARDERETEMSKTMFIAYRHGGIVPASVTGKPDQKVAAHEAVEVPVTYGRSLVDDRFAYEVEPEKKLKAKPAGTKDGDKALPNLGAAMDAAKAKLAGADLAGQEKAKPSGTKDGDKALPNIEAAMDAAKARLAGADLVGQEMAKPADTKDGDKVLSDLEAAVDAAKTKLASADLVGKEAAAADLALAEKALADARAAG